MQSLHVEVLASRRDGKASLADGAAGGSPAALQHRREGLPITVAWHDAARFPGQAAAGHDGAAPAIMPPTGPLR
jgi:hypothetical protein